MSRAYPVLLSKVSELSIEFSYDIFIIQISLHVHYVYTGGIFSTFLFVLVLTASRCVGVQFALVALAFQGLGIYFALVWQGTK